MDGQSLTIIRGVSGSGKSDFGLWLMHGKTDTVLLSADHYRYDKKGEYKYDKSKDEEVYRRCFEETASYIEAGYSVIVANTFTKESEFEKYVQLAREQNVKFYSVVMERRHAGRNTHGVPKEKIKEQAQRFELKLT